jgi:hypothetical protein
MFPELIVDGQPLYPWVRSVPSYIPDKMFRMANLTLIYGLRLLPEGEVTEIQDATLKLSNGHEAHVTMHVLEGSREEIEKQLRQSLDAFFDFYPEI